MRKKIKRLKEKRLMGGVGGWRHQGFCGMRKRQSLATNMVVANDYDLH